MSRWVDAGGVDDFGARLLIELVKNNGLRRGECVADEEQEKSKESRHRYKDDGGGDELTSRLGNMRIGSATGPYEGIDCFFKKFRASRLRIPWRELKVFLWFF